MDSDQPITSYRGKTRIVPLDVQDAAAIQRLEEEVRSVVDDIDEDDEIYVSPRNGGEAVEVRVLEERTE